MIRRPGIPVQTKLFAAVVALVALWALGHLLLSMLIPVQVTVPIPQTTTTPATGAAAAARPTPAGYAIAANAGRLFVTAPSSRNANGVTAHG